MDRPYGISDFAFPTRWDRESGPDVVERAGRGSDRPGGQAQRGRETSRDSIRPRCGFDRSRTIYRGRHRDYSLRESEVRTLADVGKFRVVPIDDLVRFGYNGDRSQMESDIRNLARQGLVDERTIEGHSSFSTSVLTLTKDLLRPRQLQKIYLVGSSSFVLRHGTRFWTQFVSIWTQMDPSFFAQLGRWQAGAEVRRATIGQYKSSVSACHPRFRVICME